MIPDSQTSNTNPDALLDRVLTGLRETPPPTGMDHRILQALRQRSIAPASPKRFAWFHTHLPHAIALGWSAAAAAVLLTTLALYLHHPPREANAPPNADAHLPTASLDPSPSNTVISSAQLPHSLPTPQRQSSPVSISLTTSTRASLNWDALARDETFAPSQPPPPLPITREERLIRRFAERHNAFALAALDASAAPARTLQERSEFVDFFDPPRPSLDNSNVVKDIPVDDPTPHPQP